MKSFWSLIYITLTSFRQGIRYSWSVCPALGTCGLSIRLEFILVYNETLPNFSLDWLLYIQCPTFLSSTAKTSCVYYLQSPLAYDESWIFTPVWRYLSSPLPLASLFVRFKLSNLNIYYWNYHISPTKKGWKRWSKIIGQYHVCLPHINW